MNSRGSRRTARIALLAIAAALGAPAIAAAGVATSEGGTAGFSDPTGANDDLSATLELISRSADVDPQGWNALFYAGGTVVTPGAGCGPGFVGTICPFGAGPPGGLVVDLGAGDDQLELDVTAEAVGAPTRISVAGGPGNDLIATVRARADLDGGDGDDAIKPDERRALELPPPPTPGGVIHGGGGTDTVDYEHALDPIAVSLDGVANDGRPGEGDNVHPDVENVTGSHFGNTLVGSAVANVLIGGSGADRITGAGGRDQLDGRDGNDTLDALDGAPGDRVQCGEGADVALVDAGDIVAACAQVTWAPRLTASKLRYRDGRIALALRCPEAAKSCRGTVLLRSGGSKPKTFLRAGYRVKRGKRTTLRVKPTRSGRSAFKRRTVKATALVQPRGVTVATGPAVTVRR
jgi:Ca2+-binding RTX toxin-like protein